MHFSNIHAYLTEEDDHHRKLHECAHNEVSASQKGHIHKINVNYNDTDTQQQSKRSMLSSSETSNIRINAYYDDSIDSNPELTTDEVQYMKSLVGAVERFYEQSVSVIPVDGPLYLSRNCQYYYTTSWGTNCVHYNDTCGGFIDVPESHFGGDDLLYFYPSNYSGKYLQTGEGITDTDLIIYVSYGDNGPCDIDTSKTLAWATVCYTDQYGRPVGGTINFCPFLFTGDSYWKDEVVVTLHEITHILIMDPNIWDGFVDYNYSNVVNENDAMGDGLDYIISDKVAQLAQEHFNCDSVVGLALEDNGGTGSAGSHWDEQYMQSSLMGSQHYSALTYVTDFTFGLMEDSGWYTVDYNYTEPFYWLKNAGCAPWNQTCVANGKSNFPAFYCDGDTNNLGCLHDYNAPSYCLIFSYGSALPAEYRYFADNSTGGTETAQFCPFEVTFLDDTYESACKDDRGNTLSPSPYPASIYGINSRCVDTVTSGGFEYGYCFDHECIDYNSVSKQWQSVNISVSGSESITCTQGEHFELKTSASLGIDIKCPNIDVICGDSTLPFQCLWGNYNDMLSECICSPGYMGTVCDEMDNTTETAAQSPATREPTSAPTEPIYTEICMDGFPITNLNDNSADYDVMWEYYPSYINENGYYLYWNIFEHLWIISNDRSADLSYTYFAYCSTIEFQDDIKGCNGYWYVWNETTNVLHVNATTYYGKCNETFSPTSDPTVPNAFPTIDPTWDPTVDPTVPTNDPTFDPTLKPTTEAPTTEPTWDPTIDPTTPTVDPTTRQPTSDPTADPTSDPSWDPTDDPTADPTTAMPTMMPTMDPTMRFAGNITIVMEYENNGTACDIDNISIALSGFIVNATYDWFVSSGKMYVFTIEYIGIENVIANNSVFVDFIISSELENVTETVAMHVMSDRFIQDLMDSIEENDDYEDCFDFVRIIETTTTMFMFNSTESVSGDDDDDGSGEGIDLIDFNNYNSMELLIVAGIALGVLLIVIGSIWICIKCSGNKRDRIRDSDNVNSVEFGRGFGAPVDNHRDDAFRSHLVSANTNAKEAFVTRGDIL